MNLDDTKELRKTRFRSRQMMNFLWLPQLGSNSVSTAKLFLQKSKGAVQEQTKERKGMAWHGVWGRRCI